MQFCLENAPPVFRYFFWTFLCSLILLFMSPWFLSPLVALDIFTFGDVSLSCRLGKPKSRKSQSRTEMINRNDQILSRKIEQTKYINPSEDFLCSLPTQRLLNIRERLKMKFPLVHYSISDKIWITETIDSLPLPIILYFMSYFCRS